MFYIRLLLILTFMAVANAGFFSSLTSSSSITDSSNLSLLKNAWSYNSCISACGDEGDSGYTLCSAKCKLSLVQSSGDSSDDSTDDTTDDTTS